GGIGSVGKNNRWSTLFDISLEKLNQLEIFFVFAQSIEDVLHIGMQIVQVLRRDSLHVLVQVHQATDRRVERRRHSGAGTDQLSPIHIDISLIVGLQHFSVVGRINLQLFLTKRKSVSFAIYYSLLHTFKFSSKSTTS